MDCNNIIQQGEQAKYQIAFDRFSFTPNDNDFQIKLSWGMPGSIITIPKSEMVTNAFGEWYFMFDTSDMLGVVTAECTFFVPDTNYDDGYRKEVDRQFICFVAKSPLPQCICLPVDRCTDHTVTYTRTEESDVQSLYVYLTDVNGNKFISSDDKYTTVLRRSL